MTRVRRKFLYVSSDLLRLIFLKKYKLKLQKKTRFVTRTDSTVPKILLRTKVKIHNGTSYVRKNLSKWTLGYKLGEFALTRKPFFFPRKKTTKRKFLRR